MVTRYTAKRKEYPIEIELETGEVKSFTLRGLSGDGRDDYLTEMANKVRLDSSGKPCGVKDVKGMHSKLLTKCLFDSDGKNVSEAVIQSWASDTLTELADAAEKLSGLDKKAAEEAKND